MSEAFARRYKLQQRIAVGGTAEVFHALFFADDGSRRPVVIKRILPQFACDERFRRLFLEEACVAVTVTHPNIVRVLDYGELGQTCYIALEWVEGMDLGSLLKRAHEAGRLPSPTMAAYFAAQIGEALQFVHGQTSSEGTPLKIIHRDVSPQNILVSYQGDVKLTDFGIAKSAIRQETTVDGTLRGKLDYMAPEQAALGDVDHRADLFALGCVLYELLHGAPPFRGTHELETLERLRNANITVPVAELSAPPALVQVLERALAPTPEARYQQAHAMVADLRAFIASPAAEPAKATAEAVSRWSTELAALHSAAPRDAVDLAVRQLLGQGIDEPPPKDTTVFGHAAGPTQLTATIPVPRPRWKPRPLHISLVVLGVLALGGWLLWASNYFRRASSGAAQSGSAKSTFDVGARERVAARLGDGAARPSAGPARDGAAPARVVAVRSVPPGASLFVDGRPHGQTPVDLALPSSFFVLELRRAGYHSWSRQLNPATVPATVRAVLALAAPPRSEVGYVTINSLPWSRVRIDGTFVGNTPLLRMQLVAGKHRVELLAPDATVRKAFTIHLEQGRTSSFTFDFTR